MSANAIPGVIATPAGSAHVAVPSAPAASPSTAGSIGGAVFALVVVIGLILALAWLAKRMPGLGGASNPALRIVGSLALGPRERLVVVAVGDTQLLLGVGAGGTRTLHTLEQPLPVAAPATPAFAQLLAQHFGKKA
ncbi:MAG TPA: flagellar biosynthetic protein FliO [Lysobacter sp.]